MKKRKICVVTGTRADYGLLYWLMKEIAEDPELKLQVIATGMHLSPEFGLTYKTIEQDGFLIDARVEMLMSSDTPVGIGKSIGMGVIGFTDTLERLQPDIVVLLGDRYEIFAAAQAAMVLRIPIAHISGGETTEGAIDEVIRHSLTKLSHFHYVGAELYRKRVIQLGEAPETVFNFGDPGLDNIQKLKLLDRHDLEKSLNFVFGTLSFLVTYHPVTLSDRDPQEGMYSLLQALDHFKEANIIITKPNSDAGGRSLIKIIDEYAMKHPHRVSVFTSLGQLKYLSAMKYADIIIGNSSSGIVEAPAMHKPTIDIGDRQRGRLKAASIIKSGENETEIVASIKQAMSEQFQSSLLNVESLYGYGNASYDMKEHLKRVDLSGILRKRFFDL